MARKLVFNPFTGILDWIDTTENFSYETVPLNKTVTVPLNQQMICYEQIIIEGTLWLEGDVIIIE